MIHVVLQEIDLGASATIQRDVKTLEDDMNSFIRNPDVTARDVEVRQFESSGSVYMVASVNYDLRRR